MKGLKIQGSLTTMLEINNWRCVIYNPLFGSCTCIRWLYNLALMLGHIICQDFGLCCQTHNLVVVGIWVTSAIDRYMEQQLSPTILQNNWEMFRINYLLRVTGPQLTLRKSNVQLTRNIFQYRGYLLLHIPICSTGHPNINYHQIMGLIIQTRNLTCYMI